MTDIAEEVGVTATVVKLLTLSNYGSYVLHVLTFICPETWIKLSLVFEGGVGFNLFYVEG